MRLNKKNKRFIRSYVEKIIARHITGLYNYNMCYFCEKKPLTSKKDICSSCFKKLMLE